MKKFRKIMAVLVAAMMIAVMVTPMMGTKVWAAANDITVTYNGGGNTDGSVPTQQTGDSKNGGVVVVGNTGSLVKTDSYFVNWKDTVSNKTYYPGDSITTAGTYTLTAQWITPTSDNGRLEESDAVINIANAKKGETYTAYKIFDLASFTDNDVRTGQHNGDESTDNATEWYSYVIREHVGTPSTGETEASLDANPWWTFITKTGFYDSNDKLVCYAYTDAQDYETAGLADDAEYTAMDTQRAKAYFTYSQEPITLVSADGTTSHSDYHIIKATSNFQNLWDDLGSPEGSYSSRTNEGVSAGLDYADTTVTNKVIQDFAQQAVKYAVSNSITASTAEDVYSEKAAADGLLNLVEASDHAALGYYLVKTTMGSLASLDTTNRSVTIFEKNDEPDLEKKVLKKDEDAFSTDPDSWVMNTDANIADYVQFRTVITAEQGLGRANNGNKLWKLHDVMEDGLDFVDYEYLDATADTTNDSTGKYGYRVVLERGNDKYIIPVGAQSVTVGGKTYAGTSVSVATTSLADNCDFEITFSDAHEDDHNNLTLDQINFIGYEVETALTDKIADLNPVVIDVKDGDKIYFYYYAKLNNKAAIWGDAEVAGTSTLTTIGDNSDTVSEPSKLPSTHQVNYVHNTSQRNENYTVLTYGDKGYTQLKYAAVTTYQFDIAKTRNDKANESDKLYELLANAKFKMYKVSTDSNDLAENGKTWELNGEDYYAVSANAMKFDGAVDNETPNPDYTDPVWLYTGDVATDKNTTAADGIIGTTLTSKADAVINVNGLEAGTYLIEEIQAPLGYDKLAHPIVVTIYPDADNDGDWEDEAADSKLLEGSITSVEVRNNGSVVTDAAGTSHCWKALVSGPTSGKYFLDTTGTTALTPVPTDYVGGQGADDSLAASTQNLAGVHIINTTGEELPSTGGMGTTVLYIVGGMMVILAGAYLFFSRRRQA